MEAEERLTDYENQIENLTRERANLMEEIQKNASSSVQTTDNERQIIDDQQQDKLAKMNTKLKRALQTLKEKINRIVTERPDLFTNIGEETNERLDHLISTVEHQATKIDALQAEHSGVEEQLRNEIRELQR
jgi:chromosome segregation ATPase